MKRKISETLSSASCSKSSVSKESVKGNFDFGSNFYKKLNDPSVIEDDENQVVIASQQTLNTRTTTMQPKTESDANVKDARLMCTGSVTFSNCSFHFNS